MVSGLDSWLSQATLAPVVRKVDNTIQRINHYPADSAVCFVNTYPLDSHLSGGERYPPFEQPGPGLELLSGFLGCVPSGWNRLVGGQLAQVLEIVDHLADHARSTCLYRCKGKRMSSYWLVRLIINCTYKYAVWESLIFFLLTCSTLNVIISQVAQLVSLINSPRKWFPWR